MVLMIEDQDIGRFIMVGDRVLIKPRSGSEKTRGGLFLPPGVEEKRRVQWGYVIKCGPGYPVPSSPETDEPWKDQKDKTQYIPLQAREGDLAVYLQEGGIEIEFNREKYLILPHSAILMLIRDEALFE
ncbi:MAG: co-chaperone GroES family protein [Bacteroidales bacterium]|jgi:co-chaperonin GroES (HSP10)|nr:co-chaperone GroES family protein [Bacteroidales bacterium]NLM93758.1 co-chaperone GroES [Bacteroidales bacterium]